MPTTTNFGWTTPADTDLVKDGAAAMRTLGNAIDSSFVDLKGGTTNQVLAKNSNTDLDFKWVADATGIPATIFDAKGDLIAATAADTADRLAVGTNGQVLTADSTATTGLKWATPASGAITAWSLLNAGGTALTGATTITVSGISSQKEIFVFIDGASSANTGSVISVRPNSDNGLNYTYAGPIYTPSSTYSSNDLSATNTYSGGDNIPVGRIGDNAGDTVVGGVKIETGDSTGWKFFTSIGTGSGTGVNTRRAYWLQGLWEASAAITSIQIVSSSGNFDAGTVYVFGGN